MLEFDQETSTGGCLIHGEPCRRLNYRRYDHKGRTVLWKLDTIISCNTKESFVSSAAHKKPPVPMDELTPVLSALPWTPLGPKSATIELKLALTL